MLQGLMAILVFNFTISGMVSSNWSQGFYGKKKWPYVVGIGSLGIDATPSQYFSTSVKFLYYDIMRGSDYTETYHPYLQEAWLEAMLLQGLRLKLGHQIMAYREGMFLHDLGDGSDAIKITIGYPDYENKGIDIFVLRKRLSIFENSKESKDFIGFYGIWLFKNQYTVDLYGGYSSSIPWPKWLGLRISNLTPGKLGFILESVGVKTKDYRSGAYQVVLKYFFSPYRVLGISAYGFGKGWIKPVSYPVLPDYFYNNWTGFGEAMNWVVLPLILAPYLSSSELEDPYALYWPDQHNFHVLDINFQSPVGQKFSFRLDYFDYFFHRIPENFKKRFIGHEIAFNLFYQPGSQGAFGLSTGYFLPGKGLKDRGFKEKAFVIRLWGTINFQIGAGRY